MLRHYDAMNINFREESLWLLKTNDPCVYRQTVINEIERETDGLKSQLIFISLTVVDRWDFGNKMERTDLCLSAQQNICKSETHEKPDHIIYIHWLQTSAEKATALQCVKFKFAG